MNPIAECCADAVAFSYRSMDRLVLNAYIPTLQTPGAMALFFRQVQRKPIPAGKVFKDLTDRFVARIMRFAQQQRIPILRVTGRTRPGEVAPKALKAAERAGRFGVVAVLVHQESARVFASTHAGGRATNYRVKEDRRLVNHYYFYLRDKDYGEGFVRISSYPPFQTRIWMNAHGYLTAQLRLLKAQAVVRSTALDRSTLERMVMPSEQGGKRVPGIRFGAPGSMRMLEALGCAGLTFRAFTNADLRKLLTERFGVPPEQATVARIGYELRKLRGKGLIRKVPGHNRYTLTGLGYRVALYFTKLHQCVLSPLLDAADWRRPLDPGSLRHPVDRALHRLDSELDALIQLCGLKHAA